MIVPSVCRDHVENTMPLSAEPRSLSCKGAPGASMIRIDAGFFAAGETKEVV